MTQLIRLARYAARIPLLLAVVALFLMMAMTFADVLMRSALNTPREAATELTRIMMAIVVSVLGPLWMMPLAKGLANDVSEEPPRWAS